MKLILRLSENLSWTYTEIMNMTYDEFVLWITYYHEIKVDEKADHDREMARARKGK